MNPLEKLINDLERQISINKKSIKKYCKQISECDSLRDSLIFSYSLQGDIIEISIIENWLPSIKENPIKANENLVDFIFREMYGLKSPHHMLKTDRDRHYYLAQLVDLRHQLNNALDNLALEDEIELLERTLDIEHKVDNNDKNINKLISRVNDARFHFMIQETDKMIANNEI